MKTLLLAAGRSKRFWPLREKSLQRICGKTLIEHQLHCLREAGCEDITLIVGEHNMQELNVLLPNVPQIQQQNLDDGMRGALLTALPNITEPVLIVGGNDVVDSSAIRQVMTALKGNDGAILAKRVTEYFPGGYLTVSGNRITSIVEKPGEGKEPSDMVNIVVHAHNDPQALLTLLKSANSNRDDGYEVALAGLFKNHSYAAVPYEGFWQPVKYPWHLLRLLERFLPTEQKIDATASIHASAVVEGPVVIGPGCKILPHATVRGPAYLGSNVTIGNNALIRGASIDDNCVIGYNSEVKNSVVGRDVWTHITYIGDSVVAENVSFGGGSMTGNFRLDEAEVLSVVQGEKVNTHCTKFGAAIGAGVRCGIQVGMNPGVKIGVGSFIAGGTYVASDVPDGSFVDMHAGELRIRPNKIQSPSPEERGVYRTL